MGTGFWSSSTRDKVHNGTVLGLLFGLLLASSVIPWINSIVMFVVNYIPTAYQFAYIEYIVWGAIGALAGFILDKY